jgi:hypothetical protein
MGGGGSKEPSSILAPPLGRRDRSPRLNAGPMRSARYRMVRCDTTTMRSTERRKPRLCWLKWGNGSCVGGWVHYHQRLSRRVRRKFPPLYTHASLALGLFGPLFASSRKPTSPSVAPVALAPRHERRPRLRSCGIGAIRSSASCLMPLKVEAPHAHPRAEDGTELGV